MFDITNKPLEEISLKSELLSPSCGAFCTFEGIVRNSNNNREVLELIYEAHVDLCRSEGGKIVEEATHNFKINKVACCHRIGRLKIGEMAVWVGATAEHRDDAFKSCRFMIDEVKKRLPIWKKEVYTNGESAWVNCQSHSLVN